MVTVAETSPTTSWTAAQHTECESEIEVARRDGFELGLRTASQAYDRAIQEMLDGPYAYAVELYPMSLSGKKAIKRMLDAFDHGRVRSGQGWAP